MDILSQEYAIKMTLKEERELGKKEGKKEGLKEGMQKGIEKGKREGKKEGKKESAINIAKNLLSMDLDIETIIKATGLDRKTLNSLL